MDVRDLYRELIVDHNRNPRNFREIAAPVQTAEGFNPLCGDRLTVFLTREGDEIRDLSFQGVGCAISVASASLMTEHLKGKTTDEAQQLFEEVHSMLTVDSAIDDTRMGKLMALAGVREFPARVKCASLCWHTLRSALQNDSSTATTE